MSDRLNNASNGEVAIVLEWLEGCFYPSHRICAGEEMEQTAEELADKIFGYIKENYQAKHNP